MCMLNNKAFCSDIREPYVPVLPVYYMQNEVQKMRAGSVFMQKTLV